MSANFARTHGGTCIYKNICLCLLKEVKRALKRIHIDGCRCDDRVNTKTEGAKRLAYNGLFGRDEKFVSGRGECVCAKLCGLGAEDNLRFELGVKRSAAESDLLLGVSHMLNPCSVLEKSRALPRFTVV